MLRWLRDMEGIRRNDWLLENIVFAYLIIDTLIIMFSNE